jgi:hypothetical protein
VRDSASESAIARRESPTLYATDQGSYVVQGWIVTDPQIVAKLDLSEEESVVEVTAKLMAHLNQDGLVGQSNFRV